MLRRVVASACTVTHAAAAALLLYDHETDRFVPVVPSVAVGLDERWLQRQGLEALQTLTQRAVAAGDVVVVPDTAATPELEFPLLAGGRRPGAVAVTPLIVAETDPTDRIEPGSAAAPSSNTGAVTPTVVGTLNVLYAPAQPEDRDQTQDHGQAALAALADLAALAITIARTQEQEHILLRRLHALDQASALLAADLDPHGILRRIVEVATELVGARYGALGIAGEDGYLADFITVGLPEEERAALGPLPRGHGLLGVLIREGQPLRLPDIRRDLRRIGFPPHHPPMTSLLGVPIRVGAEVVGDLYLTDKLDAPEFSADDQQVIELLATHAGLAIHNAQLYSREQYAHQLLREQTATMREQAQLIELAHDAILVRDPTSVITHWNQGAVEMYGWTAPEALGRDTHHLLQTAFPRAPEAEDGAVEMDVAATLERRGAWEGELTQNRRDGARLVVESRQLLVRDAEGQPEAILEINRNITARKQAEEALRFLVALGPVLDASLDETALCAAATRYVVPFLADCASLMTVEEDGRVLSRAMTHADPATEALMQELHRRYLARPDGPADLRMVLRGGQPLLVPEVTDAQLVEMAEDAAHLALLRRIGLTSYMIVPLATQGQTLGALGLVAAGSGRHFDATALRLAEDVARRVALALANARLHRQVWDVSTLRERERIGRDLHDGIIQDLYALLLQLEAVAEDAADARQQERLHTLGDQLSHVMRDVRAYINELPAQALHEQSLAETLRELVRGVAARAGLAVSFHMDGEPVPLPGVEETMLLHITREALSNVVKHARARQAQVRLVFGPREVELTISDDGQGFDPGADQGTEHHGLRNLHARAAEAGGALTVQSAPGVGASLQLHLPIPALP